MVANKATTMGDRRALLTDREREIVAGEADVSDSYRYQTIRYDRLDGDLQALDKHGDLLEELREVVCQDVEDAEKATAGGEHPPPGNEPDPEPAEAPDDTEDDPLVALSFPSGVSHDEGVTAIFAARDYLQDHGEATMSQVVTEVMPEHPVGYDAEADVEKINDPDQRNRSTWWRKVVKPGLHALPDVESPPKGKSNWTYTGDSDE